MSTVLYIHGFLSSPQSFKARATHSWLQSHRPDIDFCCPVLSSYPHEAAQVLDQWVDQLAPPRYLIGSSLGGFWATWLVERGKAQRAVLINPAVNPQALIDGLIGQPLKNYYNDSTYVLQESDKRFIAQCEFSEIEKTHAYWLMLQTGDETLDYRLAFNKYHACQQLVEEGGSHTFDNYEKWLPSILQFFEQ